MDLTCIFVIDLAQVLSLVKSLEDLEVEAFLSVVFRPP